LRTGWSRRWRGPNGQPGLWRKLCGFGGSFSRSELLEMLAHQFSVLDVDRARVRLFLCDADLGQIINQHLGLDFQLAGQFINSDLICFSHFLVSSNR